MYRNFDGNLLINHGTLNIGTCDKRDISDWYTNSGIGEYEKYKKLSYQGAIRGEDGTRGTLVETTGDVNLYGGSLTFSENNSNGAIVNVLQGGKFTMNGGSLNSGYSTNGGLIYNEGNVVINDGILVAGSAEKGGAILNKGDATLKGGIYVANEADLGSAIYNQDGTLKLQGDFTLEENNIYTENGKLEITGPLSGYIGIDTTSEGTLATGTNGYTLTEGDARVFQTEKGDYRVVLNKESNSLVYEKNKGAQIITQPKDDRIFEYERGEFVIKVKGDVKYQWQKSTDGGKTWKNQKGATKADYVSGKCTIKSNGNKYRCVVSDCIGQTISDEVTLGVDFRTPDGCRIIRVADNDGKAVIRWSRAEGDPDGYRLYRSEESAYGGFKPIKNKNGWVKNGKGKTLTDYNVKEGKTYYYEVKPYIKNSLNKSVFSPINKTTKTTIK